MQATQSEERLSGKSPERQLSPIGRLWNFLWDWCLRLKLLFYLLVPMLAFVMQRGYHYYGIKHVFLYLRDHSLEMFTIYLAIAAIGFATRHDWELQGQTVAGNRQLESLTQLGSSMTARLQELNDGIEQVKRLENSLSTHRTGTFPEYLREIGLFAKEARYLDVIVDCLDFGSFFAPTVHKQVHEAICNAKVDSLTVRILVCGKTPEPLTGPSGQGLDEYKEEAAKYLAEYCATLREDRRFSRFVEGLGNPEDPAMKLFEEGWLRRIGMKLTQEIIDECRETCLGERELTIDDHKKPMFKTLLQLRQLWFASDLWFERGKVEIRCKEALEPMFMWVKYFDKDATKRDLRDKALFTFANAARGPHQLGYSTQDSDLVTTFRLIFEDQWKRAKEEKPEPWLEHLKSFRGLKTQSASGSAGSQKAMF